MGKLACSLRLLALAACAAAPLAHAQGFAADYSLAPGEGRSEPRLSLAPGLALGGGAGGAGLSLQAGRNWFGQVGLAQGPMSPLVHSGSNDILNVSGGYRFSGGQTLSLQLSRGRGPGDRLGLAVNYDWPRYFVRFSYDPQGITLSPQDALRVSAGVRF